VWIGIGALAVVILYPPWATTTEGGTSFEVTFFRWAPLWNPPGGGAEIAVNVLLIELGLVVVVTALLVLAWRRAESGSR
jgi:hypothetical protein